MVKTRHIVAGGGTFQHERFPPTLQRGYIAVDERGLPQMLLALRHYAQRIRFFDLNDEASSTWLDLLTNNETLYIAAEIPFDPKESRVAYQQACALSTKIAAYFVYRQVSSLEQWLGKVSGFKPAVIKKLFEKISNNIREQHNVDLASFYEILQHYNLLSQEPGVVYPHIESLLARGINGLVPASSESKSFNPTKAIENTFLFFLRIRSLIATESKQILSELLATEPQGPAASILLSFLKVYQQSQSKLNQFSERLLDHYYKDIQQHQFKEGLSDFVHLTCQLNGAVENGYVAKGTRFVAGKNSALKDILYETTRDAPISGAQLSALKRIQLQRDERIAPECYNHSVTRIISDDLLDDDTTRVLPNEHAFFGHAKDARDNEARTGIIFASDVLELNEGTRKVTLRIECEDAVLRLFHDQLCQRYKHYSSESQMGANTPNNAKQLSELRRKFTEALYHLFADGIEELATIYGIADATRYYAYLKPFIKLLDSLFNSNQPEKLLLPPLKVSRLIYRRILSWFLLFEQLTPAQAVALYSRFLELSLFDSEFNATVHADNLLSRDFASNMTGIIDEDNLAKHLRGIERIQRELAMTTTSLLNEYFGKGFDLSYTTGAGWAKIKNYVLGPLQSYKSFDAEQGLNSKGVVDIKEVKSGFELSFILGPNEPAFSQSVAEVHGENFTSEQPLLQLEASVDSETYVYSFFKNMVLKTVDIAVDVQGVKDLTIQNEYGMVDITKPFLPFGVSPENGNSCFISGVEFARKSLKRLSIHYQWKGLPACHGGFATHYEAYNKPFFTEDFKVDVNIASDGQWTPRLTAAQKNQQSRRFHTLFTASEGAQIIDENNTLDVKLSDSLKPFSKQADAESLANIRALENGLIRLQLKCDEHGFGHKLFPMITSEILTDNVKKKASKKAELPKPPYTPEIKDLFVNYSASESISLFGESQRQQKDWENHNNTRSPATNVYYRTPLGIESVYEHCQDDNKEITLFPNWDDDGNVFIAFELASTPKVITLYFELKNNVTSDFVEDKNDIKWACYTQNGWKQLSPHEVLYDATKGLLRTGIVTLNIADIGIARNDHLAPKQKYWIRVSSSSNLDTFPSIVNVSFDAIMLKSLPGQDCLSSLDYGLSDEWRPVNDIASIQSYSQNQPAFSYQNEETDPQLRQRVFEHLRHKRRAINTWDYERLVLEHFPNIYLVKCLNATSTHYNDSTQTLRSSSQLRPFEPTTGQVFSNPGCVTLVVVPKLEPGQGFHGQGQRINPIVLQEITDFIQSRCPIGVQVDTRNATFEKIQARCDVSFNKKFANDGYLMEQLQEYISDYLSPWTPQGNTGEFDWELRAIDLQSHIQKLPFVEQVSKLALSSIIPTVREHRKYVLKDMIRMENENLELQQSEMRKDVESLSAHFPWSIAVPAQSHIINVVEHSGQLQEPSEIGVKQMKIGTSFIIK